MKIDVNDCDKYILIKFADSDSNGWIGAGYFLNKEQVASIVKMMSEWLKKQEDKNNEQ